MLKQTAPFVFVLLVSAAHTFAFAQQSESPKPFSNESEAGLVLTSGNANTQSYSAKQVNTFTFSQNKLSFLGRYNQTSARGIQNALYWRLGLRYERELTDFVSAYVAQSLESDLFAGYLQRYLSDIGLKHFLYKEELFKWFLEVGYRYTVENRIDGTSLGFHFGRLYTEAERTLSTGVSAKLWVEYLPNFTVSSDYQLNTEASISALLTSVFSIKTGYLVRYRNTPPPTVSQQTDTTFTTSLVAKF